MNTLEVLTKARALVDKGWLQGGWYTVDREGKPDRVCTAGAIRLAAGKTGMPGGIVGCSCGCGSTMLTVNTTQETVLAEQALADVIGIHWQTIPEWNDMTGRTKAQVLAAFDKAIEVYTPPPTYDAAACVAEAIAFGKSKVTYTLDPVSTSWVPDTVPDSLVETTKVLVSTA